MSKQIPLAEIRTDGGTQMRQQIDTAAVEDYAAAFKAGAEFPPVKVFWDGVAHWLADGFHRWHAARKAGLEKIKCDVEQGTVRDAILYAVGANRSNGMRRTNGDKRVCVMTLLHDKEWVKRSDRWIADKCGVHNDTVGEYRKQVGEVSESDTCETGKARKVDGKDGKTYTVKRTPPKRADLHVPPIDEEIAPIIDIEEPKIEVTPRPPLRKKKSFDQELALVKALADLVAHVKRTHYESNFDKGRFTHELNTWANEIAEAIEEANAA